MIQLAMSIPGFSNLPLSDQIALIKGINPALDEQLLSFFCSYLSPFGLTFDLKPVVDDNVGVDACHSGH